MSDDGMMGLTWARLEAMLDAIDAATNGVAERPEFPSTACLSIFREGPRGEWLAICYLGGRRLEGKGVRVADAAARLRHAVVRELREHHDKYARALAKAAGEGGAP